MMYYLGVVLMIFGYIYFKLKQWRGRSWLDNLTRKQVFITGCDSGFGFGLAKRLDLKGVPVVAGCMTDDGRKKIAEECSSRLKTVLVDVTNPSDVQKAYEFVKENTGNKDCFWGVVNNAGIMTVDGPLEMFNRSDYVEAMNVNFLGTVEVVNTFLPLLKSSGGRIVNMCSISGKVATPGISPYGCSQFAIKAFSDSIRYELQKHRNINVSVIMPSSYNTPMLTEDNVRKRMEKRWTSLSEEKKEVISNDYCNRYCDQYDKDAVNYLNPDMNGVLEAYEHALFSSNPKNYYYVDSMANLMSVLWDYAPSWMINYIFTASYMHTMFSGHRS